MSLTFADEQIALAQGRSAGWEWIANEAAREGKWENANYRWHQADSWRRIARRWRFPSNHLDRSEP